MDNYIERLILLWSLPSYVFIVAFDWALTAWQGRKAYSVQDTATNVYLALLNGTLDFIMRYGFVLAMLGWCFDHRILHLQTSGFGYWFALFILEDFAYYTLHCVDHFCRFFWAAHVTHHSSILFNITTGFRSSVFQPLYRGFYFLPLAFLGFDPAHIMVMYAATQIYGTFVHTEHIGRVGFLEWIFVTPSHHRVHHASNPKYLDKNMGMCLIIWDRIFGTFAEEDPAEPPRYGLTKNVEDRGPINIVFHEWRAIVNDFKTKGRNLKEKLGYVFGPPGWQPKPEERS